ncbi:MAG: hypothetical protein FWE88_00715 [Phycisphaerae bacterium]|nr:hypothetical protein [Phycisphaerae bacterium]
MSSNEPHRAQTIALALLATVGVAAWVVMYWLGDRARLWQSLLVAFVYFSPLAGGLVVWSAVVNLSNGRWTGTMEKAALWGLGGWAVAIALFVLLAALFVPSWASRCENPTWACWQSDRRADAGKDFWLSSEFLFARNAAALLAFWAVAAWYVRRRMRGLPARGLATGVVLLYVLSMTLIGYDLVMSLDPVWFSSLLAPYVFISGMYTATAAWAIVAADSGLLEPTDRRHDLGKLIVTFSLLTMYMMYGQLLCIWYGNLPPELRFVVPRLRHPPMQYVSLLLLGTVYLGPLVLMLPRWVKRRPAPLRLMAVWVLVFMYVERWWLIVPTFHQGHDVISLPIDLHAGDAAVALAAVAGTALGIRHVRRAGPDHDVAEKGGAT